MSTDRQPILIYDINTIPYGMEVEKMMFMFREYGVVFYDGMTNRSDCIPRIYSSDKNLTVTLVNTKLMKAGEYKDLLKEMDKKYDEAYPIVTSKYPDYCAYNGRPVNKYVYYVREILGLSKETTPMSHIWLDTFNEEKDNLIFPELTVEMIELLDRE